MKRMSKVRPDLTPTFRHLGQTDAITSQQCNKTDPLFVYSVWSIQKPSLPSLGVSVVSTQLNEVVWCYSSHFNINRDVYLSTLGK